MRNQGLEKPAKAKLKDKVANHKEEIDAQESPQHPRKEGDSYLESGAKHLVYLPGRNVRTKETVYLSMKNVCGKEPQNREAGNRLLLWWSGPARD